MKIAGLNVDNAVLQRIQNRVMIVGRFNRSGTKGGDPERYLFTNSRDTSSEYTKYRATFTASGSLDYEKFVSLLQPKISESVRYETSGGSRNSTTFASVRQEIPANGDEDGTVIIDTFNYFFTRAVSKTDQTAFDDATRPTSKLLDTSERDRGKEILKQIRRNLTTFCEFQPRNQQLLIAAAYAFHHCKGDGLPGGFNAGNALPKEFAPAFIDFIYDENTTKSFEEYLPRIDFDLPFWDELRGDAGKRGQQAFVDVVNAVRDHLLEGDAIQYATNIMNANTVRNHVAKAVKTAQGTDSDLVQAFGKSRTSFNSLRQIVRSKVLLSMILEWLMQGFHELPGVQSVIPSKKAEAIENAIANGVNVAPAVNRPNKEERKKFSQKLTDNFKMVLAATVGRGQDDQTREASKKAARDALPDELLSLVDEMAGKSDMLGALQIVAGSTSQSKDTDQFDGFADACKTILLDVLMPVLYRKPIVSSKELERAFQKESLGIYLAAILLSDQNQNAFVRIAEDQLEEFENHIKDGKIADVDGIQTKLLTRVYKLLADPAVGEQIEQGMTVIREVQALQEMAGTNASTSMGEAVVAGWTDELEGEVLEATESTALVDTALKERVTVKVKALKEQQTAVASGKPESSETGEGVDGNAEGVVQKEQDAAEDDEDAADNVLSKLTGEFDTGIDRIMHGLAETKGVAVDQLKTEEVTRAASLDDDFQDFVGVLADRVKAYEKTMDLIYRRYNENEDKDVFRNKVERMTLINLMLLWREELGFGKVQSNLYRLLLDLILETNPDNPDRADFLNTKSLTEYFDNEDLANGGFTKLENVLRRQTFESLQNVVNFVSELQGVKYLMDRVGSGDAEVIVVNADASEFKDWFESDNVKSAAGTGRFRTSGVSGDTKNVTYPALIYFTDIAFKDETDKISWLEGLAKWQLRLSEDSALSAIIPPICVSTGAQGMSELGWETQGKDYQTAVRESLAPVVIVGPSPRLNSENDGFPTVLPAGYLLAARVMGCAVDGLSIEPAVGFRGEGRFCTLCPGSEQISKSLDNVVWGSRHNYYSLAADLYLYIVMLIILRVKEDSKEFVEDKILWRNFCFPINSSDAHTKTFRKANSDLGRLVFGSDMSRYALGDFIPDGPLKTLLVGRSGNNIQNGEWDQVQQIQEDYEWFNRALAALTKHTNEALENA